MLRIALIAALLSCPTSSFSADTFFLGGDPIGEDNSNVDGNGALFAWNENTNFGEPGIIFEASGIEVLQEVRAIVGATHLNLCPGIDFSEHDMRLKFFRTETYFANGDEEFSVFATASNVPEYVVTPEGVVPKAVPFAYSGTGQTDVAFYDLRYDLEQFEEFDEPLTEGDWIMTFAGFHHSCFNGYTLIGVSTAPGPVAVNSNDALPRQNAFVNDSLRLALSLQATYLDGDYDRDGDVDDSDYLVWQSSYGSTNLLEADGNDDGVVDAADYTVWRDNYSNPPTALAAKAQVPEPTTMLIYVLGCITASICGTRSR